jgi:hypothetical protein
MSVLLLPVRIPYILYNLFWWNRMRAKFGKMKITRQLSTLAMAAIVAACASAPVPIEDPVEQGRQTAAGGIYKIGTPYQIEGNGTIRRKTLIMTRPALPLGMALNLMADAPPMARFLICAC